MAISSKVFTLGLGTVVAGSIFVTACSSDSGAGEDGFGEGGTGNAAVGGAAMGGTGNTASGGAPSGGTPSGGTPSGGSGAGPAGGSGGSTTSQGPDSTVGTNGYGEAGPWKGYLFTYVEGGTIAPECDDGGSAPCFQTAGAKLCTSGSVNPDAAFESFAMLGWNINQGAMPPNPPGTWTSSGTGLVVDVANNGGSTLRVQLQAGNDRWCAPVPSGGSGTIPWTDFNTACWDNSGDDFAVGTAIEQISINAPGEDIAPVAFDFCLVNLALAE